MIGYHGTDADFTKFSTEHFGSREDASPNGALGVWIYLSEDLARAHGRRTLRIEAAVRNTIRIPVHAMMRDHRAAGDDRAEALSFFAAKRAELLREGYQAIEVVEKDDQVMIAVILDPDTILHVTEMPSPSHPKL